MSTRLQPILIAALLTVGASAFAQDPAAPKGLSAAQGPATIAKDDDKAGGDPGADRMFEQAKAYVAKMQGALHRGDKMREDAKKQKDLIKLNCLNEKLSQAQSQVSDAEQAMAALSEAVVRNDTAERRHEFQRLRIYYQKVLVLGAEADNCSGEEQGYVGPAQIEVDVDPTIPQGDPTDPGLPKPNSTAPPAGQQLEQMADSPDMNTNPPSGLTVGM